jgi:enoyl-CoA hydratase/carnithine racemase
METAHELANTSRSKPREALALGKALFYRQLEVGIGEAYRDASATIAATWTPIIAREGVDAFFDKRPPRWNPGPAAAG